MSNKVFFHHGCRRDYTNLLGKQTETRKCYRLQLGQINYSSIR